MKIIKTDGVLSVEAEQLRYLDGLNAEFIEKTLLTEDALIEQCRDADALMVLREPITARVLAELKNLKVIGRFGVGLDSIDIEAASRAGVQVTYVPDANLVEVSTHAMALILALTRRLKQFDSAVRAGRWAAMTDSRHHAAGQADPWPDRLRPDRTSDRRAGTGLRLPYHRLRPIHAGRAHYGRRC